MSPRPLSRRQHARYPCRLPVRVEQKARAPLEAELLNIGMGGALLLARAALAKRPLRLTVSYEGVPYALYARLLREDGPDPAGGGFLLHAVAFEPRDRTRKPLQLLLDRLRSLLDPGPKLSRDYWNL